MLCVQVLNPVFSFPHYQECVIVDEELTFVGALGEMMADLFSMIYERIFLPSLMGNNALR